VMTAAEFEAQKFEFGSQRDQWLFPRSASSAKYDVCRR